MTPPDRFADATFSAYAPRNSSQARALRIAQSFAEALLNRSTWWRRLPHWLRPTAKPTQQGLYFVGPVGTGKTHLLAAIYHALHPVVPCGFMHSSTLFRQTTSPSAFADQIADQFEALCLDEVEIDDPANEVRLVQLLRRLEVRDVKLLATSNVTPSAFISNRMGPNRFEQFLTTEFQEHYAIVPVEGTDYRREDRAPRDGGRGWVGPAAHTRPSMRSTYDADEGAAEWLTFADFREVSRTTAHPALMRRFGMLDSLYLADVRLHNTDDALRLLRVVDDLYLDPDAPDFYFTAEHPPEQWFEGADAGIARDIAEKFTRTASRVHAMCTVELVPAPTTS